MGCAEGDYGLMRRSPPRRAFSEAGRLRKTLCRVEADLLLWQGLGGKNFLAGLRLGPYARHPGADFLGLGDFRSRQASSETVRRCPHTPHGNYVVEKRTHFPG